MTTLKHEVEREALEQLADRIDQAAGGPLYIDHAAATHLRELLARASHEDKGDSARLDWLCNVGKDRFVQEDDGMWRAYQDEAPKASISQHWQAVTTRFYPTARDAIDAAMAAAPSSHDGEDQ